MPPDTQAPETPPVSQADEAPQSGAAGLDTELNDALSKHFDQAKSQPDPKPEAKADEPKPKEEKIQPEPKPAPELKKKDEPLPDPDAIEANPPGKASAASKEGWNALRGNYKRAREIITGHEASIQKLEKALAEKGTTSTQEVEKLKGEIAELSKFRAMVDIQADPEFVSKYDQPIEKGVSGIRDLLTSLGVAKDIVDKVDVGNTSLMDQIIGHVEEHRDKIVARKLQRKVEEVVDLMEKRDETLTDHKTKYKEHLETRKKEAFSKGAEEEGRTLRHLEAVTAAKTKEGQAMFPYLNKQEVPEGANQAQIDQVNNHNRLAEAMQSEIAKIIKMRAPEEIAEVAVKAASANYYVALSRSLLAKVASLESEIQKISNVSSETGKTKTPQARKTNGQFNAENPVDTDSALADFFAKR